MTVPPAPTPPSWRPVAPPRPSRWPTFTFLVIALAAIALAIGSWFRPLPSTKASAPPAPIYTDQQVASAKAIVCAAFEKIDHAVALSDAEGANSTDRSAQLAAAALGRQVLDFGSRYLFGKGRRGAGDAVRTCILSSSAGQCVSGTAGGLHKRGYSR
jgi:hypothetical protein